LWLAVLSRPLCVYNEDVGTAIESPGGKVLALALVGDGVHEGAI
jgi:hypothetical protein|tara:strand:+ start:17535 stop:17666 length:132 start_codon:yes stop_codon:yes gene_type:complete